MRHNVKMQAVEGVRAGETCHLDLRVGPTYNRLYVKMKAAVGAGTVADVPVGNWPDYIGNIRVLVDGNPIWDTTAEHLIYFAKYHGQPLVDGILPMFFNLPWLRTVAGEDTSRLITMGMTTCVVEFDLKDGINIGEFKVDSVQSASEQLSNGHILEFSDGGFLRIQRFHLETNTQGWVERNTFPKGVYLMSQIDLMTDKINGVEVITDNYKRVEFDKTLRDYQAQLNGKTPQNGVTTLDFAGDRRLKELMPMTAQNVIFKMEMTETPLSFQAFAVSYQGVNFQA